MTFGEGYMNGDIEVEGDLLDILQGFHYTSEKLSRTGAVKVLRSFKKLAGSRIGREAAIHNAQHHYDIGNNFYKLWLDATLSYTCAYFLDKNDTLEQAQRQKLKLNGVIGGGGITKKSVVKVEKPQILLNEVVNSKTNRISKE